LDRCSEGSQCITFFNVLMGVLCRGAAQCITDSYFQFYKYTNGLFSLG
jgi:hypothetical protein